MRARSRGTCLGLLALSSSKSSDEAWPWSLGIQEILRSRRASWNSSSGVFSSELATLVEDELFLGSSPMWYVRGNTATFFPCSSLQMVTLPVRKCPGLQPLGSLSQGQGVRKTGRREPGRAVTPANFLPPTRAWAWARYTSRASPLPIFWDRCSGRSESRSSRGRCSCRTCSRTTYSPFSSLVEYLLG
uniref:Putative secreted protein n=1 Tax=Ixodes ricinus TaxID=34613 RepID=A0A147BEH2_IXORI